MVRSWYSLVEKWYITLYDKLTTSFFTKLDLSLLLGNALENFDIALYGFLAPVMAPLFFPYNDQIVQLICMYGIASISTVARPVGIFVFCILAKKCGSRYALFYSLYGIAITSIGIGFFPCY